MDGQTLICVDTSKNEAKMIPEGNDNWPDSGFQSSREMSVKIPTFFGLQAEKLVRLIIL